MNFIPNTDKNRKEMLNFIGINSTEELFSCIKDEARLNKKMKLAEGMSEFAVSKFIKEISQKSKFSENTVSFMGGGIYDHYIPETVPAITSRGDFFTAYTPYQAEVSQGTLQAIFEYQTMISELTGLEVSNASHYDGASSLAAICEMIFQQAKKKKKILISPLINPNYLRVIKTQFHHRDFEFVSLPIKDGKIDISKLNEGMAKECAGVVIQNPNYFGIIEDSESIVKFAKDNKLISGVSQYPISLAILKRPGDIGFDIACGEGQPLGNAQNYGGPGLGFLACTKKLMRKMPGRIVGKTVDVNGKVGYVLTLQAREQHIRREKSSSNICSNQALCALAATVYMATVGYKGLRKIADNCVKSSHYLREELGKISGLKFPYSENKFFNEFVVDFGKKGSDIFKEIIEKYNIAAGIPLESLGKEYENMLLITSTEKRTKDEINRFVSAIKEVI